MKYKYVGAGDFLPGLPANDVDDGELSEEQLKQLELGVTLGLYRSTSENEVTPAPKPEGKRGAKQSG